MAKVPDELVISEALSWEGTRYVHAQCVKGSGVDCVNIVIAVGKKFGWIPIDYKPPFYEKDWAIHNNRSVLKEEIAKFCDEVTISHEPSAMILELLTGDTVLMVSGQTASHAAIYLKDGLIIHASLKRKKVVVSRLIDEIKDSPIDSVWRHR